MKGSLDRCLLEEILRSARSLPPTRRRGFLESLCRGDPELLARLESHEVAEPGISADLQRVPIGAGSTLVGRYEIGEALGSGSFAAVYRATDRLSGRRVAVKVLPGAAAAEATGWRREVAVLRRARLPGVVHLLDDGVAGDDAFLVMKLIEGRPFPGGAADWETLAPRIEALLSALGRLHAEGILHRDVKPENVLVDTADGVTLVDLGVAYERGDAPAGVAGTPAYFAPELFEGRPATVRSDLYAVGVMVYEVLAGRPPHPGEEILRLYRARREAPPPPLATFCPDLPPGVSEAVGALLAPVPGERPDSARRALRALFGAGSFREESLSPADPPGDRPFILGELEALFDGPDRVLHLREDAAVELHRRTGGEPERVRRVVRSWLDTGVVRREGARLLVGRHALDRLRAAGAGAERSGPVLSPGRHREIGLGLPPAHPDRLPHLLAGDRPDLVPAEAAARAWGLWGEGRLGEAISASEDGLATRRRSATPLPGTDAELLEPMLASALGEGTAPTLDLFLYHVERSRDADPALRELEAIGRSALLAVRGDAERALRAEGLPRGGRFARWTWSVLSHAARYSTLVREREVLVGAAAWARMEGTREARSHLAGWTAWLRYREGRYSAAAALHFRAERLARRPMHRIASLLFAGSAAMEGADLATAGRAAREAMGLLREFRNSHLDARAEWLCRAVEYRSGEAAEPDLELVDAVRTLGLANLEGLVTLTEAAVAWRSGKNELAAELAGRAAERWGSMGRSQGALLARALRLAAGGDGKPVPASEADALLEGAASCSVPGVKLQVAALVATAAPDRKEACREVVRGALRALPARCCECRREVLSLSEAVAAVDGHHGED